MADRPRRSRGRPPLRRAPSPMPARTRQSPSPVREPTPSPQDEMMRMMREEQQAIREEQRLAREGQQRMMDTIREMAVAVARMEKRPAETGTPVAASEPDRVPSQPVQYPHIPSAPPAVGQYEMPAPSMPNGTLHYGQTSDGHAETVRPSQNGESSGSQGQEQQKERWDVDRMLKNGGRLFYGSTDPEVAVDWFDTARGVMAHIGCPPHLWVRVVTGANQRSPGRRSKRRRATAAAEEARIITTTTTATLRRKWKTSFRKW